MDSPRLELREGGRCEACRGHGADHAGEPCEPCEGDGWLYLYRTPTPADFVAHVVALPAEEARALLVALLRARPDEAVAAVDTCKVARAWDGDRNRYRLPLTLGVDALHTVRSVYPGASLDWLAVFPSFDAAEAAADAALLADGWVLAGGGGL